MRGFDERGHLFGLFVGLHVLLGVVGEIRVAGWVPGVEQCPFGLFEDVLGDGESEPQDLQRVVDVFLAHIGHGASLAKQMDTCQSAPFMVQ